jgi:hypothetical protein
MHPRRLFSLLPTARLPGHRLVTFTTTTTTTNNKTDATATRSWTRKAKLTILTTCLSLRRGPSPYPARSRPGRGGPRCSRRAVRRGARPSDNRLRRGLGRASTLALGWERGPSRYTGGARAGKPTITRLTFPITTDGLRGLLRTANTAALLNGLTRFVPDSPSPKSRYVITRHCSSFFSRKYDAKCLF